MTTSDTQSSRAPVHTVAGVLYEPLEGRARVLGTGLEVFEIVRTWKAVDQSWERLTQAYHWLTDDQLRAALTFYAKNSALVEDRLARDSRRRVEEVWSQFPESRPKRR